MRLTRARLQLLLMLPLIAIDCLGNVALGGSWRNTVSSTVWRNHERAGWDVAMVWIDWAAACPAIGQVDHCRRQAEREAEFGSVWKSWAAQFNWRG